MDTITANSVTIVKWSPTTQSANQHILSPTSVLVTNIEPKMDTQIFMRIQVPRKISFRAY